jgi:hypothetical protein
MMNWKGFGRKWLWPNQHTIPPLICMDWIKPREISVIIARVLVEIQTEHLPSTILERYRKIPCSVEAWLDKRYTYIHNRDLGEEYLYGCQSRETEKFSRESRGTRNQEWQCWRGSAAIYPTQTDPRLQYCSIKYSTPFTPVVILISVGHCDQSFSCKSAWK